MITPAPTSRIDPGLCRGTLAAITDSTATRPGFITVTIPNTSYQLHLLPTAPITTPVGRRIVGIIRVQARRIDIVTTGGRFIEPVIGFPHRIQGIVIAADPAAGAIVINAGTPIHATPTDPRQSAADFQPGQLIAFDALEGATFTPAG